VNANAVPDFFPLSVLSSRLRQFLVFVAKSCYFSTPVSASLFTFQPSETHKNGYERDYRDNSPPSL